MASRSAAIVIDLLMRTGSFVTDTERAAKSLKRFEADVIGAGKRIAAGGAAIVAAIGGGLAIVNRLAEGIAVYQGLAEKMGDTASRVSGLQLAADKSGTALDSVAAASVKLTSALSKTDDEGSAVAKALAAINIPLEEFRRLSPTEQLKRVADGLAEFEDGASKTAVAVALFGKAGADLIPFLNDLADAQAKAILTDEQIKRADDFTKQMATLRSELSALARVTASELIHPFAEFINYLSVGSGSAGVFSAAGAVLTNVFQAIAIFAANVVFVFKAIGNEIGAIAAQAVALARLDLKGFNAISQAVKEDAARARSELDGFEKRILGLYGKVSYGADDQSPAEARRLGLSKPALNFSAATGGGNAKQAKQEIDRAAEAIKNLNREIQVFGQENDILAKTLAFQDLKPTVAQLEQYKSALVDLQQLKTADDIQKTIDALRAEYEQLVLNKTEQTARALAIKGATAAQIEQATALVGATDALRAQNELIAEGKRLTEQMRTPLETLLADYEQLNKLLQANAISQQTYARAVQASQDKFAKATEPAKKAITELDDFAKNAAENIQRSFGDVLVDAMNGNFKNIGDGFKQMVDRMVAEAIAAKLVRSLFGEEGKGGGLFGNILGTIGSALGFGGARAGGGDVFENKAYLVGEQGPELFVPRTNGSVVPAGMTRSMLSGTTMNVSQNFNFSGPVNRQTVGQVYASASRGLADASRRNN